MALPCLIESTFEKKFTVRPKKLGKNYICHHLDAVDQRDLIGKLLQDSSMGPQFTDLVFYCKPQLTSCVIYILVLVTAQVIMILMKSDIYILTRTSLYLLMLGMH